MAEQADIQRLMEQFLESGGDLASFCDDDDLLLAELSERLERHQQVQNHINQFFPEITYAAGPDESPAKDLSATRVKLPVIDGYHVESILGFGGTGVVYKALHLKLQRTVAIKMLLMGVHANPQELTALIEESRSIAGLSHPNVIKVFHVDEFDGLPFFTMEHIDGGTLSQKLNGTPQPAKDAASLLATLTEAIAFAHKQGVVHRDLKPANILISANGVPKIADFSLARRLSPGQRVTISAAGFGTPGYMAPEQAMGNAAAFCPAVDIYALGAVLYELLTGRPPFASDSPEETRRQVIHIKPAPPSQLNAHVPRDLETICLKCLEKNPQRRYLSANDLAEDINRYLQGRSITARPAWRIERCARWVRRNPTESALCVACLVLLLIGAVAGVREYAIAAQQRIEIEHWDARLAYIIGLEQQGKYAEAREVLYRIPDGGSEQLRATIDATKVDIEVAEQVNTIRLSRVPGIDSDGSAEKIQAAQAYEELFQESKIGATTETPETIAQRVRSATIRAALTTALDDWLVCEQDSSRRAWLLSIVLLVDPDPTGWRDRTRGAVSRRDQDALVALTGSSFAADQSPRLLVALGEQLHDSGADAVPYFMRIHQIYPDDFWVNFKLGEVLQRQGNNSDAIRYYQAAIATRPEVAVAYRVMGSALSADGRLAEAKTYYDRAIAIDPDYRFSGNPD